MTRTFSRQKFAIRLPSTRCAAWQDNRISFSKILNTIEGKFDIFKRKSMWWLFFLLICESYFQLHFLYIAWINFLVFFLQCCADAKKNYDKSQNLYVCKSSAAFLSLCFFFLSHCFHTHMHTTLNLRQQDLVQLLSGFANVLQAAPWNFHVIKECVTGLTIVPLAVTWWNLWCL